MTEITTSSGFTGSDELRKMLTRLLLAAVLLSVTYGGCPKRCYCTESAVYCQGVMRFPDFSVLPSWTKNISIYKMHIPYIPASAFKDLPNVKTISIYDGFIGQIDSCAFQGIQNVDRIELYHLDIKTIEMYAFSDMRYVKSLSIYMTRIDSIRSYAFFNIKGLKSLTLHTLAVRKIHTRAFYGLRSVDEFYMYGNNMTVIRRGAFSRSSFRSVSMFYNDITNLECNTIDVLKKQSRDSFSFYANDLYCGCNLAWLLQPGKRGLLTDSRGPVKCSGPRYHLQGKSIAKMAATDLYCRKVPYLSFPRQCPPIRVPPPARTRARQCLKRY